MAVGIFGCSSHFLKVEEGQIQQIKDNKEYSDVVKVEVVATPTPAPKKTVQIEKKTAKVRPKKKKKQQRKVENAKAKQQTKKHLPELEDSEGFDGRRPIKDPFRIGEKVSLKVSYFGVEAGELVFEVAPPVKVNGNFSYHFKSHIKSTSVFSMVYKVDDWSETYVDYETLLPFTYEIHIKESKQVGEIKGFFDHKKKESSFWERNVKEGKGLKTTKYKFDIKAYSQNVVSSLFYLRTFTYKPGKKIKYRVADRKENLEVSIDTLRREEIEIEAGKFKTIVIQPQFKAKGIFKPVGDIYFWLTDDDRKKIVKFEMKIKIGTIVGEATKVLPGEQFIQPQ